MSESSIAVGALGLRDWLRRMPKAELHLHLDGSLRPDTALELARERDMPVIAPAGTPAEALDPSVYGDGPGAELAAMRARLVAPPRCADQVGLLAAFELPVALLQDAEALERAARELVEDVAREGTCYVEMRWAPSLHTRGGLTLRRVIAAVARGAQVGSDRTGTQARLIVTALRTHPVAVALQVARAAVGSMADGVVGFDLAGREREAPDPARFGSAFELARQGGLGITCHAGEWGGAASVRRALTVRPARIAHGAPAADDPDLVDLLVERGITLDLCPTSNVQAGVVTELSKHPLARLLRAGIGVTLSTDDRTVSDLTLVTEMERVMRALGVTPAELLALVRHAYRTAFLHHDEPLRARLLTRFDAWAAAHPEPPG